MMIQNSQKIVDRSSHQNLTISSSNHAQNLQ